VPCGSIDRVTAGFDPYAVLGGSRDATGEQIVQARHQLVRRYQGAKGLVLHLRAKVSVKSTPAARSAGLTGVLGSRS